MNSDILSIVYSYLDDNYKLKHLLTNNKVLHEYLSNSDYIKSLKLGLSNSTIGEIKNNNKKYIFIAGKTNNLIFLKYLLKYFVSWCDVCTDCNTYNEKMLEKCFMIACENGSKDITEFLLKYDEVGLEGIIYTTGYFLICCNKQIKLLNLFDKNKINWFSFTKLSILIGNEKLFDISNKSKSDTEIYINYANSLRNSNGNKILKHILNKNNQEIILKDARYFKNYELIDYIRKSSDKTIFISNKLSVLCDVNIWEVKNETHNDDIFGIRENILILFTLLLSFASYCSFFEILKHTDIFTSFVLTSILFSYLDKLKDFILHFYDNHENTTKDNLINHLTNDDYFNLT